MWSPIGAEKMANGNYEVAFYNVGTDNFSIWTTDSNGNYISDGGTLLRGSLALETVETSFQQDLNGDGVIGVAPITVVEAFGSTKLDQDGDIFFLDPVTGGTGPSLKLGGSAVNVSGWTWLPIGAEQMANGNYEVAFRLTGTNSFDIWTTDSSGNYLSDGGVLSGAGIALQSAEASFQQDLNGDGIIGVAPPVGSFALIDPVQNNVSIAANPTSNQCLNF